MELEILIKYIEGTANPGEQVKVEEWIGKDANKQYLEKVRKAWFAIDGLKEFSKLDVDKDWELVEKRISESSEIVGFGSKNKLKWLMSPGKVAAIFILGAFISSMFFYSIQKIQHHHGLADSFFEFNVPAGQKSDVVLPDGTKIMVNAGSNLRFPKAFDQAKREVWLDGEAYFEVAKNAEKPFFVHTSDVDIKVLGTTFNVKAYHDEPIIEAILLEGSVVLNSNNGTTKPEHKDVLLQPEHKAIFIKNKDAAISDGLKKEFDQPLRANEILVSNQTVNTDLATSWIYGKLVFENTSLEDIARQLERHYGVRIVLEGQELKNIKFTGTLKKISVEQTLRALKLATSLNYAINEDTITITKNPVPMK
jgi:ferric-dicitrate binding protein FerR (iron transport regulator)